MRRHYCANPVGPHQIMDLLCTEHRNLTPGIPAPTGWCLVGCERWWGWRWWWPISLSIFSFRDGAVQFVRSLWHYKRRLGVGWPSRKTIEECRFRAQTMRCYGIIPFICLGRLCERAISGFSTNIIQQFEVNRTLSHFLDSSFTLASRARWPGWARRSHLLSKATYKWHW